MAARVVVIVLARVKAVVVVVLAVLPEVVAEVVVVIFVASVYVGF